MQSQPLRNDTIKTSQTLQICSEKLDYDLICNKIIIDSIHAGLWPAQSPSVWGPAVPIWVPSAPPQGGGGRQTDTLTEIT